VMRYKPATHTFGNKAGLMLRDVVMVARLIESRLRRAGYTWLIKRETILCVRSLQYDGQCR